MTILTDIEKEVVKIVKVNAEHKKFTTFKEIFLATSWRSNRRVIGKQCSHIGQKCKELGLPKLTVLVVYSDTRRTGEGYFPEFAPEVKTQQEKLVEQKNESEKCFNCSEWDKLLI